MTETQAKRFSRRWKTDGVELVASIPPYCWMYKRKMAIDVGIVPHEHARSAYRIHTEKSLEECSRADLLEAIKGIESHLAACNDCGAPRWDATSDSNGAKAGQCEACFMRDLQAQFQREREREGKRQQRLDAKRKREGYTHKTVLWIHPPYGDDYAVEIYTVGKPVASEIRRAALRYGSRLLDDFKTTAL